MTDYSGEKFLVTQADSVHYVEGRPFNLDRVIDTNMSEGEIKEMVSRTDGTDPSEVQVIYPNEPAKSRAGRIAVAFSAGRWNSSWEPGKSPVDPNLN